MSKLATADDYKAFNDGITQLSEQSGISVDRIIEMTIEKLRQEGDKAKEGLTV